MSIELYALARLKAINSPNYFNNIKTELFNSFKNEGSEALAKEVLERAFTKIDTNSSYNLPEELINKNIDIFRKIFLTSGIRGNLFLESAVKIEGVNSGFNKIKDTIAEIVIKDGIVSRIDIIKYPKID